MVEIGLNRPQVSPLGVFLLPHGRDTVEKATLFGDLVIVIFVCSQILDGAFTYIGLQVFGHAIEANPLIAWLISTVGPAGALASAKMTAIAAGAFLHLSAVHGIVAMLTGFYLLLAIGPWTHLLFFF
jgi:hypothetical protein